MNGPSLLAWKTGERGWAVNIHFQLATGCGWASSELGRLAYLNVKPKLFCYRNRAASQAGCRHRLVWPKKWNKTRDCGQGDPHCIFTNLHQHGQELGVGGKSFRWHSGNSSARYRRGGSCKWHFLLLCLCTGTGLLAGWTWQRLPEATVSDHRLGTCYGSKRDELAGQRSPEVALCRGNWTVIFMRLETQSSIQPQ